MKYKYIIFVGDGMADLPVGALNGLTPLEHIFGQNMGQMASAGEIGTAVTVPISVNPGTDTAFYSIMGYDVEKCFTGRAPLEAAGMGIALADDEIAFRCNLASISQDDFDQAAMLSHSSFNIDHEEGRDVMNWLIAQPEFQQAMAEFGMRIEVGKGFRHIAVIGNQDAYNIKDDFDIVPPHDIVGKRIRDFIKPRTNRNRKIWELMKLSNDLLKTYPFNAEKQKAGLPIGNCIWLWGAGTKPSFRRMQDRFGLNGAVISAVPLVNGIGRLCGLTPVTVEGMTGDMHTNYQGKAEGCVSALKEGYDFVLLHVEAPDECSHDGNLEGKIYAIQKIDEMLKTIVQGLNGVPFRMLFMSDHITSVESRTHDWGSVPYFIYDSTKHETRSFPFDESTATRLGEAVPGDQLINRLLQIQE